MSDELRASLRQAVEQAKSDDNKRAQGIILAVSSILNLPQEAQGEAWYGLMHTAEKYLALIKSLRPSDN